MDRDHWFHDKGKAIEGRAKKNGGVVWNILKERNFLHVLMTPTFSMAHFYSDILNAVIYIFSHLSPSRFRSCYLNGVAKHVQSMWSIHVIFLTHVSMNQLLALGNMHRRLFFSFSLSSSLSLCAIIPTLYRSHEWFIAYKFFPLIFSLEFMFLNSRSLDFSLWPMNEWIGTSTLMSMKMNQYLLIVLNCFTWTQSNAFIGIQAILIATTHTHSVWVYLCYK